MIGKKVVITTDLNRRGVFLGTLIEYDREKAVCVLKAARMCVYWSDETKGVLGLASHGPQSGSKITPEVPHIELNGVTSVMGATDEAVRQWGAVKWQ